MPEFTPGEAKTAIAPITAKPAGMACEAELFLGPDDLTKVASSGRVPFVSTGASQNVRLPIAMPSEGTYHGYIDAFTEGLRFLAYKTKEDVVIRPAVIGFTLTLINCPIHRIFGAAPVSFTDGTGAFIPCGSPGSWVVETVPFNFSIAVYADLRTKYGYLDWIHLATYSFSAMVENGKDYIYDCATREFGEITEVRKVRAYWKGTGVSLYLWENGLTFNGKRAIDPIWYIYGADLPWALKSTFIVPIGARITQIEFKLLGVWGYTVRFDYKWTDQKPGEAEVTIAQGSKSPPYVADPYHAFTHYTIPI